MNSNERDERWWEQWWLHDPEAWRGTWREDWRIMGQEGYLLKKHLQHRQFCRDICKEDFTEFAMTPMDMIEYISEAYKTVLRK